MIKSEAVVIESTKGPRTFIFQFFLHLVQTFAAAAKTFKIHVC